MNIIVGKFVLWNEYLNKIIIVFMIVCNLLKLEFKNMIVMDINNFEYIKFFSVNLLVIWCIC